MGEDFDQKGLVGKCLTELWIERKGLDWRLRVERG